MLDMISALTPPSYFQSSPANSGSTTSLNKIFDGYRGTVLHSRSKQLLTCIDDPDDNPDGIGTEGAMKFLGDINVQLDEVACLGIAELLKSPSMGEFTREGFVNGWKAVGYAPWSLCYGPIQYTNNTRADNTKKMTEVAQDLRERTPTDPQTFRRVYRYAFALCRLAGQRNLQFEIAADQWRLFFTPHNGGVQWNTATTPWLDWWIEFLEERGKRPVNKDLWEQVEVFMRRTREDEGFGWWSPDGAWPGALDDFVGWVQGRRKQDKMEE
jgi:DCN1-like protein 1/2